MKCFFGLVVDHFHGEVGKMFGSQFFNQLLVRKIFSNFFQGYQFGIPFIEMRKKVGELLDGKYCIRFSIVCQ
jgi:hypothetical protein